MGIPSARRWLARVGSALLLGGVLVASGGAAAQASYFQADPAPDGEPGVLIVGGSNATQTYSFMVSMQSTSGSHFCGGSLISSRWVVTAKHCVQGRSASSVRMRIGTTNRTSGGSVYSAVRIVNHPSSDLALVQTSTTVSQAPVVIAASTPVGQSTRIIGWGQTCPTSGCGGAPITLQQLDTTLVSSGCGGIRSGEICVGNPGGTRGACYGDSGGPAITPNGTGWRLTGATSRSGGSSRCGVNPAIYVSVPAHRSWITGYTGALPS